VARETDDEDLRQPRNVTIKASYAEALDEFRQDQAFPPNRTEVIYRALDMFLEEHGYEPVED